MIDVTTSDHHGHWDVTDIRRLCEYRDQLRGNLSLAEEGLANAMQEIENAKHDIEQLMASVTGEANEVERLRTERDELLKRIQNLQRALNFWLPCVPAACRDERIVDRIAYDADLLAGYEGPAVDTAEELGWIRLRESGDGNG
jgi:hypothetical protein